MTFLQRRLYPRLERGGVSVYEYQPSMMHAKTMLVDDRLVIVGSINLDFLSMEWLEEGCLVVDDRPFAAELERRWGDDLSRSRQVAGPRRRARASRSRPRSSARRRRERAPRRCPARGVSASAPTACHGTRSGSRGTPRS